MDPRESEPYEQEEIRARAGRLLSRNHVDPGARITPLRSRGRRVFTVEEASMGYVLKAYPSPETPYEEDLLLREMGFYALLRRVECHQAPVALDWDEPERLGLMTRIDGRALRETELNEAVVGQAIEFLLDINRDPRLAEVAERPGMAAACDSMRDHLTRVGDQITGLAGLIPENLSPAQQFLDEELLPGWQRVLQETIAACETAGLDLDAGLSHDHRILSPGEFRFENALLTPDREICFVDFDHSGWDDPARVVCEFFCQPEYAVKPLHWQRMIDAVMSLPFTDPVFPIRATILFPAYQIAQGCHQLASALTPRNRYPGDPARSPSPTLVMSSIHRSRRWLKSALKEVG